MGIHISPHFIEEVILKEHLGKTGVGTVNFPAKLPEIVLCIRLLLASLNRILLSINLVCKNASMPIKEFLYNQLEYITKLIMT